MAEEHRGEFQRTRPWSWIGEGAVRRPGAQDCAGWSCPVYPGAGRLMPLLLTGLEIGLLVEQPQHWHETDAVIVRSPRRSPAWPSACC